MAVNGLVYFIVVAKKDMNRFIIRKVEIRVEEG